MTSSYSFPNAESIQIQDLSSPQQAVANSNIPVHLPFFIGYAADGRPNVPLIGNYAAISQEFGTETFDIRGKFFYHPNLYALKALQMQQAAFIRVVPQDATPAGSVLQVAVTPSQITQYQRDQNGAIVMQNGVPQTLKDGQGATVTQPGITLTFSVRALQSEETFDTLVPSTATVNGQSVTTYPIFATAAGAIIQSQFVDYPGSGANNDGWSLYYSDHFDSTTVQAIGAMTYRFSPMVKDPNTAIASVVYDVFNDPYTEFSFKPNAFNPNTNLYMELGDLASANYTKTPVPYSFQVYSENVQTILTSILAVSPELANDGFVNGNIWMINFLSGNDHNGNPYEHLVVDSASLEILNADAVNYQSGGTDGTMSKTALEAAIVSYLEGDTYPQWFDYYRYPFTHFYDSGFTLSNKQLLLKMFTNRDDIKIDFTTQDLALAPNTQVTDQSSGVALRAAILLYPESVIRGTQTIRASVYQQSGKLNSASATYPGIVPCSYDRLIKRCLYDGGTTITGTPKGRPNSEVTVFDPQSISWTPSTAAQKQLSWDTGLNYLMYCDLNKIFYADLRSIYPTDTSLLSDDVTVDYLIYIKHIARRIWTYYSGVTGDPKSLFITIQKRIDKEINRVLGGRLKTVTTIFQTDADAAQGFAYTVQIAVSGDMPSRVWNIDIPVTRNTTTSSGSN